MARNQAVTATIVVRARWGCFQGSALRTGQGDGPPIFFRQRSPIKKHNLFSNSLWGAEKVCKPKRQRFRRELSYATKAKAVR